MSSSSGTYGLPTRGDVGVTVSGQVRTVSGESSLPLQILKVQNRTHSPISCHAGRLATLPRTSSLRSTTALSSLITTARSTRATSTSAAGEVSPTFTAIRLVPFACIRRQTTPRLLRTLLRLAPGQFNSNLTSLIKCLFFHCRSVGARMGRLYTGVTSQPLPLDTPSALTRAVAMSTTAMGITITHRYAHDSTNSPKDKAWRRLTLLLDPALLRS